MSNTDDKSWVVSSKPEGRYSQGFFPSDYGKYNLEMTAAFYAFLLYHTTIYHHF